MRNPILVSLLCLVMAGCSLFTPSAAPGKLAASSIEKEQLFTQVLDGFEATVAKSNPSPEVKAEFAVRFAAFRSAYSALQKADMELLATLGNIDWKGAFQTLYDSYKSRKEGVK